MVRKVLRLLPILLWDRLDDLVTDQVCLFLGKQELVQWSVIGCSLASFLPLLAHAIVEPFLDIHEEH